jgi:hypothetical protein
MAAAAAILLDQIHPALGIAENIRWVPFWFRITAGQEEASESERA